VNILYCIPQLYNSGGMERVLCQKVNFLVQNTSHHITIMTTEVVPEGKETCYFPLAAGVDIQALNIDFDADFARPLPVKWWQHQRKMARYRKLLIHYIRANHIDLCISLCGKEIAFLSAVPCATIAEIHFSKNQRRLLIEAYHKGIFWSLLGSIRVQQLVRAVKRLPCFVVLTDNDRREWEAAGCRNVRCIANPCCLDGMELPVPVRSNRRILSVGRLHLQKGTDRLIDAFAMVHARHPEWTLRIVGAGEQAQALQEQIHRLGLDSVVEMVGTTRSVAAEYQAASLFVLPSRYEGLPLALIEAMWCELPCVAFDCPHGPAELLSEGRGVLVPNGDILALANAIVDRIEHTELCNQTGLAAARYAHAHFSERVIMNQWIELIQQAYNAYAYRIR